AMKELWTKPEPSFEGQFVKFPPVRSYPKPKQKPYPPIIIGAGGISRSNDRALRDTVALGDGWAPIMMTPERLKPDLEKLQKMCEDAGRDYRKIEITMFSPVPGSDARVSVREYERAGVHRLVLFPATCEPDKYVSELEGLARTWM